MAVTFFTIQRLCISFTLLVTACERGKPVAESNSNADPPPVPDPFQSIASDGYQYDSQPKDWWMFPEGAIDPYLQDWYSKHLVAAKESQIYPDLKRTHYRFTWLRTFHHPFIFHIMDTKHLY